MGQYTRLPDWVMGLEGLQLSEKLVFARCLRWPEGCWESNSTIGQLLGLKRRTVQKAVKSLNDKGWIRISWKKPYRILRVEWIMIPKSQLPLYMDLVELGKI